ncbi:MAG: hypothetical protein K2I48_06360 [Muribaculaceae bacterium]|nr:hypothetical protein [Muribaculaceae bacterium]
MSKIQKLTRDESGKLHGGFSFQSSEEIGRTYLNNTNINCGNGGQGDTNTNCFCIDCGKINKPNDPLKP